MSRLQIESNKRLHPWPQLCPFGERRSPPPNWCDYICKLEVSLPAPSDLTGYPPLVTLGRWRSEREGDRKSRREAGEEGGGEGEDSVVELDADNVGRRVGFQVILQTGASLPSPTEAVQTGPVDLIKKSALVLFLGSQVLSSLLGVSLVCRNRLVLLGLKFVLV